MTDKDIEELHKNYSEKIISSNKYKRQVVEVRDDEKAVDLILDPLLNKDLRNYLIKNFPIEGLNQQQLIKFYKDKYGEMSEEERRKYRIPNIFATSPYIFIDGKHTTYFYNYLDESHHENIFGEWWTRYINSSWPTSPAYPIEKYEFLRYKSLLGVKPEGPFENPVYIVVADYSYSALSLIKRLFKIKKIADMREFNPKTNEEEYNNIEYRVPAYNEKNIIAGYYLRCFINEWIKWDLR